MDYSHEGNLQHFRDVVMPGNDVWLAVASGGHDVVGLLALAESRVNQIHVDPAWQGRGVGTALIDLAKQRSPEGLTLFTFQRNEQSRAFYEARGFRAVAFGVSPEGEPDLKYAWGPDTPA